MEQRRRGDTRERIQAIAVRLFADRGYDNTSLREIAEELGVTKAALYYHFKTKEELVSSLIGDLIEGLDAIIEWAAEQPRTPETRQEVIRRFHAAVYARDDDYNRDLQRFMQTNQQVLGDRIKAGDGMRQRFERLREIVVPPDVPPAVLLKATMSFFALFAARGFLSEADVTPKEQREAALAVALDLIGALDPY